MRRPAANRLVWIKWYDAQGARIAEAALCEADLAVNTNLGWVVRRSKKRVVLANAFSTSGEVDTIAIPTGWIISETPVIQ